MELSVALWELALREDASWCVLQVWVVMLGKLCLSTEFPTNYTLIGPQWNLSRP